MKKITSFFPSNSPQKISALSSPRPLFENLVRGSKSRKEGADYMGIPIPLSSYFLLHKSRYAHVWSLSLITFQALQLQYFSLQFSSLHTRQVYINSKNWKELFLKIWDSNTKYLRLKSPKYKAKLNLQKNYYIRQQNNKIRIIKKQWNNKKYSALPASLPFTFLSSDPKKENFKLHFSALQNI